MCDKVENMDEGYWGWLDLNEVNGQDGEDIIEMIFEDLKIWRIKKKRAMIKLEEIHQEKV